MTPLPEVIRQSEFLNQLVLNRSTMEELGRVEVLWMYPQAHRVLGFICKSGLLGNQKWAFQLVQIDAWGESGVLTNTPPQKTDAEKVRRLESLIDHEVWSDQGNRIGKITDCLFHLRTGEITHYLFVASGWSSLIGEVYQLPPDQIQSFGKQRVLVSETAMPHFEVYQPGISRKISQAGEAFKEEAAQEFSTFAKRAEATAEQAKTRAQQFSQQVSQQFKQKTQGLNEQVKDKTQTWLEQATEKGQTLAERVKETTQNLSERIEEQIETLTLPPNPTEADGFDFDLEADWFAEPEFVEPEFVEPEIPSPTPSPAPSAPPIPLPQLVAPSLEQKSPLGEVDEMGEVDETLDDDPWI